MGINEIEGSIPRFLMEQEESDTEIIAYVSSKEGNPQRFITNRVRNATAIRTIIFVTSEEREIL